jgi:hypothetical protein
VRSAILRDNERETPMAYAHLGDLMVLRDHAGEKDYEFDLAYFREHVLKGATFVVEDDEAYFVVQSGGKFWAIIGEIRGDSSNGEFVGTHFAVNLIHGFKYRDSAIACVLSLATMDSGGDDCIREITRERAPWVKWQ